MIELTLEEITMPLWKLFGPVHVASLFFAIIILLTLYLILKKLPEKKQTIILGILSFTGIAAIIYNLINWGDPINYLPLHLCSLNAMLLPIVVFTRNKHLGNLLMLWSNFDALGYTVAVARSSNGRLDGEWIHEDLLYARSMTVENRYDGGHAMTFTDRKGQMYLSFHSPNGPSCDRREAPVFLAIREENDHLVWDEEKPAHN